MTKYLRGWFEKYLQRWKDGATSEYRGYFQLVALLEGAHINFSAILDYDLVISVRLNCASRVFSEEMVKEHLLPWKNIDLWLTNRFGRRMRSLRTTIVNSLLQRKRLMNSLKFFRMNDVEHSERPVDDTTTAINNMILDLVMGGSPSALQNSKEFRHCFVTIQTMGYHWRVYA